MAKRTQCPCSHILIPDTEGILVPLFGYRMFTRGQRTLCPCPCSVVTELRGLWHQCPPRGQEGPNVHVAIPVSPVPRQPRCHPWRTECVQVPRPHVIVARCQGDLSSTFFGVRLDARCVLIPMTKGPRCPGPGFPVLSAEGTSVSPLGYQKGPPHPCPRCQRDTTVTSGVQVSISVSLWHRRVPDIPGAERTSVSPWDYRTG